MAGSVSLIKRYMKKYSDTTQMTRQIQLFIKEETEDIQKEIEEQALLIETAQARIEQLNTHCMERAPRAYADLEDANRELRKLENSIKKLGHDMDPADLVKKGMKISEHGIAVTVSKLMHKTRYNPSILMDHPHLLDVVLDGDPLVFRTVDADILERLIEQGDFSREDADRYKDIVKIKNPSVTIKEVGDE